MQVGLPWYRGIDWDRLLSIFADKEALHDTFADWLADAQDTEAKLRKQGHRIIRVYIDPIEFPKWCDERGLAMDGKARSRFAAEYASTTFAARE